MNPAHSQPVETAAAVGAVSVQAITHRYKTRTALDAVSFTVNSGEIFAVLGPNGGGKSTLFRILSTMMPATEGTVEIMGENPRTNLNRTRAKLGVVFQAPSLDMMLTAKENLRHQGHLYRMRGGTLGKRMDELLQGFGLAERAGERVSTFSGGMRRRLEIAKSLLHQPQILILDEPSTGLDPGARRDMWTLLSELRRERGLTLLYTTHLMDEAERADRVMILDQGQRVALDTPSALTGELGDDVITVETDDAAALAEEIEKRFSMKVEVSGESVRLERARGHEFVPTLVEAFPGRIRSLAVGKPTLEDVFLKRTGRRFSEVQALAEAAALPRKGKRRRS